MKSQNQRGIALVLALFLMAALSVLAASLMFLSQTETYASMNYRMMSQARYAAEAGVQTAAHFLTDETQYVPPISGGADDLDAYTRTGSPVLLGTQQVVLSADTDPSAPTAHYSLGSVQTNFSAVGVGHGSISAGGTTLNYKSYARLLSMQQFETLAGITPNVVQTWEITATGSLSGSQKATVAVMAIVETPKVPATPYAAFATDDGCGALSFNGHVKTNSYNSDTLSGAAVPMTSEESADVGTNGNLTISGGAAEIGGHLYTPRSGVGACTAGAWTALTGDVATVQDGADGIISLPKAITYKAPPIPAPSTLADVMLSSAGTSATTCAALGLTPGALTDVQDPMGTANCNVTGNDVTINGRGTTLSLPTVDLSAHVNIVLMTRQKNQQYNFNSLNLVGGSEIKVDASDKSQSVTIDVSGKNPDNSDIAEPIYFSGNTFAEIQGCANCSNYDAAMLQIAYGGTGHIEMAGTSAVVATFYAPKASFTLTGTPDLYGAVLAKQITVSGNSQIHYDQSLSNAFWIPGNPMLGTFTWKRSN